MPRVSTTRRGRIRWWVEGEASGRLEELLSDTDRVLEAATSVAREPEGRKRLLRIDDPEGGGALLVKIFRPPGRLRYLLRPSKARHEARVARCLRERGFAAAGPIAVGEERRLGVPVRSLSVVRMRPARDLRAVLSDPGIETARRRTLLADFARYARRLHDAGVDQDDFSPNNFLVEGSGGFLLIDFERCRLGRPLAARRWTLLAKLERHDLGVSRVERLRFLCTYLGAGADRAARRAAWLRITAAFRQVRARDARHAARSAFRRGRRILEEAGVWQVRGRERDSVQRLALGRAAAREVWIRAHQLERLGLPALRPVRLGPDWVELEAPQAAAQGSDAEAAIRRARRSFCGYGHFEGRDEWVLTAAGARLSDPRAFALDLSGPAQTKR